MKNINLNVISDKSVLSKMQIVNKCMNSFYKLTNVLFLLLLVFGSCGVSFGMKEDGLINISNEFNNDDNESNKDNIKYDNIENTGKEKDSDIVGINTNRIDNKNISLTKFSHMKMYGRNRGSSFNMYNSDEQINLLDNIRLQQLKGSRWGISFGSGYGLVQYPSDLYNQGTNCLKCDTICSKEDALNSIYNTELKIKNFVNNSLFNTGGHCCKVTIRNKKGEKETIRDMGKLRLNKSNTEALRLLFKDSVNKELLLARVPIYSALCDTASRSKVIKLPIVAENSDKAGNEKEGLLYDLKGLKSLDLLKNRLGLPVDNLADNMKEGDGEFPKNQLRYFEGSISQLNKITSSPIAAEEDKDNEMIDSINKEISGIVADGYGYNTAEYLRKSNTFGSALDAVGAFAQMAALKYCIKKAEDSLGMIRLYSSYLKEVENIKSKLTDEKDLAKAMWYPQAVLQGKLCREYNKEVARREKEENKNKILGQIKEEFKEYDVEYFKRREFKDKEDKKNFLLSLQLQNVGNLAIVKTDISKENIGLQNNQNDTLLQKKMNTEQIKENDISQNNMESIENPNITSSLKDIKKEDLGENTKPSLVQKLEKFDTSKQEDNKIKGPRLEQYAMDQVEDKMKELILSDDTLKEASYIVGKDGNLLTREEEYIILLKSHDSDQFHNTVLKFVDVYSNQFIGSLNALSNIMNSMKFSKEDKVDLKKVNHSAQFLYDNGIITEELYRNLGCYAHYRYNEFFNVLSNPDISDYQKRNYGYKWFVYSSLGFVLSSVLSGLGGENNAWMELSSGKTLSWNVYMSNIFTSFGINAQIKLPMTLPLIGENLNIHVVGVNFLSLILGVVICAFLPLQKIGGKVNSMINEYIDAFEHKDNADGLFPLAEVSDHVLFRNHNKLPYIEKIVNFLFHFSLFNDEEREYLWNNSFFFVLAKRCLLDTLQFMSISIPVNTSLSININFGTLVFSWLIFGGGNKSNAANVKNVKDVDKDGDGLSEADTTDDDDLDRYYTLLSMSPKKSYENSNNVNMPLIEEVTDKKEELDSSLGGIQELFAN